MTIKNEVVEKILTKAKQNDNIRAVYMNGSRTNPNVPKDIFQDYDIVYVVNETTPFLENHTWIQEFGDLLIKQEPDQMDANLYGKPQNFEASYTLYIIFKVFIFRL
ncbi:aminoglycoside 6-adenylyltransferase [Isobaculum melis]|uniref:Streptomycin adenylyltransferase n=1 Tax=Isobaculum melis TaxID=142588 RepID=A0A1H9UC44_9LACT|nr:aminoglycoside 6-adenylyltransferase [Isobaculum melis]SES06663.1 Streptomycin adenylyltransferase [Isobaculum melis]